MRFFSDRRRSKAEKAELLLHRFEALRQLRHPSLCRASIAFPGRGAVSARAQVEVFPNFRACTVLLWSCPYYKRSLVWGHSFHLTFFNSEDVALTAEIRGYLEILVGHGLVFIASEHRSLTLASVLSRAAKGLQQTVARRGLLRSVTGREQPHSHADFCLSQEYCRPGCAGTSAALLGLRFALLFKLSCIVGHDGILQLLVPTSPLCPPNV